MNSKGFTFVELMLIIIIIGITAVLVVMRMDTSRKFVNDTTNEQFIQLLRSARAEAVARNTFVDLYSTDGTNQNFSIRQLTKTGSGAMATYTVSSTIRTNISLGNDNNGHDNTATILNTKVGVGIVFDNMGQVDADSFTSTPQVKINGTNNIDFNPSTGYFYKEECGT
jgi:Tfp pilus assembly protein FimT